MTTLLLIRHGQSVANLEGIYVGQKNAPLSPLGKMQAEKMAEYVLSNYKVDKVYSSDLIRARDTVLPIAEGLGTEVIETKGLREIYAGDWEEKKFSDLSILYPDTYGVWLSDIGNAKTDGGETVQQMAKRVEEELIKIAEENDGKTIVCGTHATPIRSMQCVWSGKSFDEMKNVPWTSNASVTIAEYENGKFTLSVISEDSYLDGIKSILPKNV